ncbi:endonuclease-reverse transcriptase [Elysia marginata]|uniref:Endonuclease-reverse transcriptase n=1 Tax=Elysia marginata TaxID=1093978 RepID=A0AAV4HHN2_9GAST|nr:endonuclease-reverse transcriptase [Elysia marginata]
MEEQLNTLNIKSKEVGLKMHKGKTKFMTNYENDDTIQIENASIEKVQKYKYLGKSTCMKDLTKEEVDIRIRAGWSCFGRNREIFLDKNMPLSLKKQVYDQCILPTMTYGCQTWSLTKIIGNKFKVAQRAMERKILGIKIKDKIPCKNIRQQTHIKDVVLFAERQKWNWAGHVARMSDHRWTKRATKWQTSASDQEADNLCDGATVSRKQRGDYGTERLVTEIDGGLTRRATSCSGWTKPRRIVGR